MVLAATVTHPAKAEAGAISVENAWTRATPKGAKVAAGYLTIKNNGDQPDRLVAARAEFAGKTEIHLMNTVDGVMRMRPVTDGVAVPPKDTVALEPNAYHLMFMDLAGPLREGESVRGELIFERAGSVEVTFKVMGIGARGPEGHQHHHH
jgi:copper(I)-binding protein